MLYSLAATVALKSIAVLGAAFLLSTLLRNASAAARHVIWTAACLSLLALPFLSISLPAVSVNVPLPVADFQTYGTAAPTPSSSTTSYPAPSTVTPASSAIDWPLLLLGLWAVGVVAGLLQMAWAWFAIHRLASTARPLGRVPDADVELLETPAGTMPMVAGVLRPKVLLPADAATWPDDRRRLVLLHELAHVRRSDSVLHFLARFAVTFYWWNPLAWIAWREFLNERERAADDLVLAGGTRASEYAHHLLEVVRGMQSQPAVAVAAVGMAHSPLEGRVRAILDSRIDRTTPDRASIIGAALLAAAILIPLSAVRAQQQTKPETPADVTQAIRNAKATRKTSPLLTDAKAAESRFEYDTARKLLDGALEIEAGISGNNSAAYADVLMQLGALERNRGNKAPAEDFYNRAVSILGNRPEASAAWLDLGVAAIAKKEYNQAIERLERVADPAKMARAKMWLAVTRQRQGNVDEAEALFKSAVAMHEPNSPDAAVTLELYSMLLRDQEGRTADADRLKERASQMRKQPLPPYNTTPDTLRIGGGVKAPSLQSKIEPKYSEEARVAKLTGTCVVQTEIWPDGQTHNARVLRGIGLGLDEKALEAIAQWKFNPGTKDGKPVKVQATIEVNFRLM